MLIILGNVQNISWNEKCRKCSMECILAALIAACCEHLCFFKVYYLENWVPKKQVYQRNAAQGLGKKECRFKKNPKNQQTCSQDAVWTCILRQTTMCVKSGLCLARGSQRLVMKCSISKRCLQLHRYVDLNYLDQDLLSLDLTKIFFLLLSCMCAPLASTDYCKQCTETLLSRQDWDGGFCLGIWR